MKILIIDDEKLLGTLIKNFLADDSRIDKVEAIQSPDELDEIKLENYKIIFLDLFMPNEQLVSDFVGFETLKKIKNQSDSKIIIISTHYDIDYVNKALELGADGYMSKNISSEELINSIDYVMNNRVYLSSDIQKVRMNPYSSSDSIDYTKVKSQLSAQQKEILFLISEGFTDGEIGEKTNKTKDTISYHRKTMMKKLGVNKIHKLLKIAVQHNFI